MMSNPRLIPLFLLERGANPNATDRDGWTPLNVAAGWGYTEIVKLLLQHGADANAKAGGDWSPLHTAVHEGYANAVEVQKKRSAKE